jgi:hypothetical protein
VVATGPLDLLAFAWPPLRFGQRSFWTSFAIATAFWAAACLMRNSPWKNWTD